MKPLRHSLVMLLVVVSAVCGTVALQAQPVWPAAITLQDFPLAGGVDYNGYYLLSGADFFEGTSYYQRFSGDGGEPGRSIMLSHNPSSLVGRLRVYASWPANASAPFVYVSEIFAYSGGELPPVIGPFRAGATDGPVVAGSAVVGAVVADPYDSPGLSWSVALVYIPTGFLFGLSVWAIVLAVALPIRWVRLLTADAAT